VKKCSTCGLTKSLLDFHKQTKSGNGLRSKCKVCVANNYRNWWLKSTYGITLKEYQTLLIKQGGVCAICSTDAVGGKYTTFNVDHCHKTNKIRGLLCTQCNLGIGKLGDSFAHLKNATHYLSKSEPLLFPGIWKRIAPPILNTNLKFSDLEMQKDCLKNKSLKEMGDNADIVAAPQI